MSSLFTLLFLDTCPEPPQNLICPIGLRNTCVDDASCRPGTVCCSDGCRKRCVDPSSFSAPDSGSGHQGEIYVQAPVHVLKMYHLSTNTTQLNYFLKYNSGIPTNGKSIKIVNYKQAVVIHTKLCEQNLITMAVTQKFSKYSPAQSFYVRLGE